MDARVKWQGEGIKFEGISGRNVSLVLGGKDDAGFSPMELVLLGLGGCTGMDCMVVMQKKRAEVHSFEIQIHAERAETHPQKYIRIEMEYIFIGNQLDQAQAERAVDLSANKYCSVKASLDPSIEFVTKVTVKQA